MATSLQTVHILAPSLHGNDAAGRHTFALMRLFLLQGMTVRAYYNHSKGGVPADLAPLVHAGDFANYQADADLTVVQYSSWFPLAERLRDVAGASLFWIPGVTLPSMSAALAGSDLVQMTTIRTSLAWYANLTLVNSPAAAQELHHQIGYPLTRIRIVAEPHDSTAFAINVARQIDALQRLSNTRSPHPPLADYADIALRGYTIRSDVPFLGRLIAWVRRTSTSHLKAPYLDRMIERQVNYNHLLVMQIAKLQSEVARLRGQVGELQRRAPSTPPPEQK